MRQWICLIALVGVGAMPAMGVIVGGETGRNTSAPTGLLAGSGWQYEGEFGNFMGTAIAPNYFVTASHIGGTVGESFTYNGKSYVTTAMYDDPGSDLRIWQVEGDLGTYAPLDTSVNDAGEQMIMVGRGTQRGEAILSSDGEVAGWKWGEADGVRSWGTNTVNKVINGGAGVGALLAAKFDGGEEGTLSSGDSGGGVFVNEGGEWKLAGVNFAVQSGEDGAEALLGQSFYASSIAGNQGWIDSVLGNSVTSAAPVTVPEPGAIGLVMLSAAMMAGRWRR